MNHSFAQRAAGIPRLGLGLSVDVYSPNLYEVADALQTREMPCGYLEVFRADTQALAEVSARLPTHRFAYHAEGLWLTQPDWLEQPTTAAELATAVEHLFLLDSLWLNHECASKQMAGYPFGTYLPPLFTRDSADVVAAHACVLQHVIDERAGQRRAPLLLLEVPPLTYFGVGDLSVCDFFSRVSRQAPCGFVLDIGHVWTIYRYSGAWRRQEASAFLAEFLDGFPLDRVVQIHVAGLEEHDGAHGVPAEGPDAPPRWLDAHAAPIAPVAWQMLEQVLAHPGLTALKGVALEVDTKRIPTILSEFESARARFGPMVSSSPAVSSMRRDCVGLPAASSPPASSHSIVASDAMRDFREPSRRDARAAAAVQEQYRAYAEVATGRREAVSVNVPLPVMDPAGLALYRDTYVPHEILHWGGDVRDMFPDTCRVLTEQGIDVDAFVTYWFRAPRPSPEAYDFFLLKVNRFSEFVRESLPAAGDIVNREADDLQRAYRFASAPADGRAEVDA